MKSNPCEAAGLRGIEVPGTGPGILLIHGNSADHRTYMGMLGSRALAGRRLIALDLPGHGLSARTGPYALGALAAAVSEAASALGAAVILGHSLGGHVLLQGVGRGHFAGTKGIAVLGTPPVPGPTGLSIAFRPAAAMAFTFKQDLAEQDITIWAEEAFGPHIAPAPWFAEAVRATDASLRPALMEGLATEGLVDEAQLLDTAPLPIAVLHPSEDAYCVPEYMRSLRGRALWRGATQWVDHTGHYAPWEDPEQVGTLLAAFVDEVS